MSRPLRIEYEGAWYHVMNRGTNRCKIFLNNKHYHTFINLFVEITSLFTTEIHAYCSMGNHYHLLLHTPKGNLSRIMRHLDGVYTQRFNKLAKRDGSLFRGRYKALLIEENSYLLQVSRYIHLNPAAKNNLKTAEDYNWSSYRAYLNKEERPNWLCTDRILDQFNNREGYYEYVSCGVDKQIAEIYQRKHCPSILGSEVFKSQCLEKLNWNKINESLPDIKRCKDVLPISDVINKVAIYFNTSSKNIIDSRRGVENLPRILCMTILWI